MIHGHCPTLLKGQSGPNEPLERMKNAIDSPEGRGRCGQRIETAEPVFGNLRHNKRLSQFTPRGRKKVATQWQLCPRLGFCTASLYAFRW